MLKLLEDQSGPRGSRDQAWDTSVVAHLTGWELSVTLFLASPMSPQGLPT